ALSHLLRVAVDPALVGLAGGVAEVRRCEMRGGFLRREQAAPQPEIARRAHEPTARRQESCFLFAGSAGDMDGHVEPRLGPEDRRLKLATVQLRDAWSGGRGVTEERREGEGQPEHRRQASAVVAGAQQPYVWRRLRRP